MVAVRLYKQESRGEGPTKAFVRTLRTDLGFLPGACCDSMILIQCTKTKRDEPAKARNLYDASNYFCKMRDYAEATGEMWFILSAKHGLVDPETVLKPYDEFGLSKQQAQEIAEEIAAGPDSYVEIIAGKAYTDPLTPALEQRGVDVLETCRGMKIGERMQYLNNRTAQLLNGSLC